MGIRNASVGSSSSTAVTLVTTSETIVVTSSPINLPLDSALVRIDWYAVLTFGTGATAVTVRIRRGTATTGALVNGAPNVSGTAANNVLISGHWQDSPGIVAEQQYIFTLGQIAATANGSVLEASLSVVVL